ncbi:MAG: serine hydrolase domain-containing protein [Candidatus Hydrogenedentota bacterium]
MTKQFEKALDKLRREDDFAGATAAFVLPDGTVVGVATGFSDSEGKVELNKDAVQPVGTVEESFLSLVALSLEQEGVIDLDERVYHYFDSEGADAWVLELPNAKELTLRHLLTHASGLVDGPQESEVVLEVLDGARTIVRSDWAAGEIAFAVDGESGFAPGQGFGVSDTDYRFGAMVLEQVSGERYEDLLTARVLDAFDFARTETAGTGGLLSNPQDLVRWAQLLYEENALEGSYMEDLFASGYRGKDRDSEFGLGVYIHDTTAGEAYGHAGSVAGHETNLIYFPKYGVGVCVQVTGGNGDDVREVDLRKYEETLAQIVLNGIPE